MMEILPLIITVVITHFVALVSPGPDFFLTVRSALRNTPRKAMGVAVGLVVANATYITLCIIGVGAIIAHSIWLMIILKCVGGCFLLYIAYHAIKAKRQDYQHLLIHQPQETLVNTPSFFKEFGFGLASGLSNPKNIIFYLSLFSVVLTPQINISLKIALGLWMVILIFLWNVLIIFVLSKTSVRQLFAKFAFYIDKLAGFLLGVVGVKLVTSAVKETI